MTLPSQMDCQTLERQAFAIAALCSEARAKRLHAEADELEFQLDNLLVELNNRCHIELSNSLNTP